MIWQGLSGNLCRGRNRELGSCGSGIVAEIRFGGFQRGGDRDAEAIRAGREIGGEYVGKDEGSGGAVLDGDFQREGREEDGRGRGIGGGHEGKGGGGGAGGEDVADVAKLEQEGKRD